MASVKTLIVIVGIVGVLGAASGIIGFRNTVGVTGQRISFETNTKGHLRLSLKRCVDESCSPTRIIETRKNSSVIGYSALRSDHGYYVIAMDQHTYAQAGIYTVEIDEEQKSHSFMLDVVDNPTCQFTVSAGPRIGHVYICTVMHSGLMRPQIRLAWQQTWCQTRTETKNHVHATTCEYESNERRPAKVELCIIEYNNDSVFGCDAYKKAPELDKSNPAFVGNCSVVHINYSMPAGQQHPVYTAFPNLEGGSSSTVSLSLKAYVDKSVNNLFYWGLAAFVFLCVLILVLCGFFSFCHWRHCRALEQQRLSLPTTLNADVAEEHELLTHPRPVSRSLQMRSESL